MKKKIQKPFDAEAAKRGARVETREGMPVRIVCYNCAGTDYPIVALVNRQDSESCNTYTIKGKIVKEEICGADLVIVEEVEVSKFNPGDWLFAINGGGHPWLITAITPNYYEVQINTQELKEHVSRITVDNYFRLWTLDDARPGDVLVCKNDDRPFIFKGCIDEAHPGYPTAYCGINCSGELTSNAGQTWWTDSSVRPATYKEKQQFFNRLNEEGYKWDAESLTLSKIQKNGEMKKMLK